MEQNETTMTQPVEPLPGQPGTVEWLLRQLGSHGEDAGSDYDDGVNGWFGWKVEQGGAWGTLTVHWEPANEDGSSGPRVERVWRLYPVKP